MYCKIYHPIQGLTHIIESITIVRAAKMPDFMPKEKWLPTATTMLVLNIGTHYKKYKYENAPKYMPINKSHFIGTRDMVEFLSIDGPANAIFIRFKPGGLFFLLHIPLSEFNNQVVEADLLLKNVCQELEEKIEASETDTEKINHIQQRFLTLLQNKAYSNKVPEQITQSVLASRGKIAIKDLVQEFDVSYKSLERKANTFIGLTPKRLTAIVRFYQVLRLVKNSRSFDWKEIAPACGYYDQAHLINDFKKYTSTSPHEFFKRESALTKFITDTVKLSDFYEPKE